ncbi:MAG TPA: histidine phosphatase family protein [Candidatus Paceibacterota bacterium]|nr:histidine phosphatase family protein [Candidatus Paceibacterota bacterium]
MSRMIYFTRHGYQDEDRVTERGLAQLALIQERLVGYGFQPVLGVSSPARRCIETARFFTGGQEPTILGTLHAFGNIKHYSVSNGLNKPPRTMSAREFAQEALSEVLSVAPASSSLVVVGHDSTADLLAWEYLERSGRSMDWRMERRYPNQGEGVLVTGTTYELFSHAT